MIEGLKLKITSAELISHCTSRSDYHARRAAEKSDQLPGLKAAMDSIAQTSPAPSLSHMNKSSYSLDPNDAVEQLESDIRTHRNNALMFEFFASHFFDADYTLDESALMRLEILKR